MRKSVEQKPINVLSLFDGISCGRVALERAGVPVQSYTAYEIMPAAIKVSQANYPDIVHKGDVFSAVYTMDLPYGKPDLLIGGSPCFTAGTPIFTDKGVKNIEDVEIGDKVLTHKNRYKPVTAVGNKLAQVYAVYAQGVPAFYATANHPFYTVTKETLEQPVWTKTGELTAGQYLGSPIITVEENPHNLDEETCWLLGRYTACGFLRRVISEVHTKKPVQYQLVFTVPVEELDDFHRHVKHYEYNCFHRNERMFHCVITSTELYDFVKQNDFGERHINKNVPNLILNLPKTLLNAYMQGYLSGNATAVSKHNTYITSAVSKRLIYSLAMAVQKLYNTAPYIMTNPAKHRNAKSTTNTYKAYSMIIKTVAGVNGSSIVHGGVIWTPYKTTVPVHRATVYNLSVADDESYIANNRIVHNCTYWSCANGKRETTPDGQGGKLFMQYVRALKETQPQYFLYENNASMSAAVKEFITAQLGVDPICINSALVSAQQRKRLYWTNIPNVTQPEDKQVKLQDILEDITFEHPAAVRGRPLHKATIVGRRLADDGHRKDYDHNVPLTQCLEVRNTNTDKSNCLTTVQKDNVLTPLPPGRYPDAYKQQLPYRYYTRREYERLQTLPDGYTDAVSENVAKKLIGNGWTVDVVAHILAYMFTETR